MKKAKTKRFLISLVAFVLLFGTLLSALSTLLIAHGEFYSSAVSSVVLEANSKRVIFSKNMDKKLPMASTTKIMTAITALENCKDLDEKFEISPKAVGVEGTSLYLRKGDVFSTRDLLYALMLISGNDASVAIAEHTAGSTSEFVTLMNDLARKIGAKNTHFANTHGLDADGHYTTAYDLALITAYALENETFKEIVSTKNIKITDGDGENRYLKNKNKLLFKMDECVGVKTGFTNDAGRCLVSAVEKDGARFVAVVLNCGPMFEESETLLKKCLENYKLYDLTTFYDYKKFVKVTDGRKDTAQIGTKENFLFPLTEAEKNGLRIEYDIEKCVEAPLEKGSEVGEIKIFLGKDLLFCEKVYTIEEVKPKTIFQRFKEFASNW